MPTWYTVGKPMVCLSSIRLCRERFAPMAFVAMIQDCDGSPVFNPLCVIDQASLSTPDVIEVITEAYRQTIPGHVTDCVTLVTTHIGLNKYKIVAEEAIEYVDDEGHDYVNYRTFEMIVDVQFVPTFGHKEV